MTEKGASSLEMEAAAQLDSTKRTGLTSEHVRRHDLFIRLKGVVPLCCSLGKLEIRAAVGKCRCAGN